MPIYEYQCPKCSHEYEKREGFDAPAVQKCPNCGARARRVIQAPPIVFKGSGFYITDSRASPREADTAKASTGNDSDTSKASTSADSADKSSSAEESSGKDSEAAAAG